MWKNNLIYEEDFEFVSDFKSIDWEKFRNKTIFITGGTGLIGLTLINSLLYANEKKQLDMKIVALVRDLEKAEKKFAEQLQHSRALSFVVGSLEELPYIDMHIDYIVHGASPTASDFFIEKPVETIKIAVQGTLNMLTLAAMNKVEGFVFLSSMEVYGAPDTDSIITETQGTTLDTMSVRSCYPEAKRICETLCSGYASEYNVPAMVIRLAQTFGPGLSVNDQRVFAEFARCAMNSQDIVLQTSGTSKRCYLYTVDAVTAILIVLLKGEGGNAYNAANPDTYCSILEMAELIAAELADDKIKVHIPENGEHARKFPPTHCLNLGVEKIKNLGWTTSYGLADMYRRMIREM